MAEPRGDSVLATRLRRFSAGGRAWVEKRAQVHVRLPLSLEELAEAVLAYHRLLEEAGVPQPELASVEARGGEVVLVQSDAGPSVLERAGGMEALLDDGATVAGILEVLATARRGGVALDPHPKNFCASAGGALSFVDLWQPIAVAAYREARLAAEPEATRDFVRACLEVFDPPRLVAHFVGDVLGQAPSAVAWAEAVFRRAGASDAESVARLLAEARAIRALEDERLRRGIYLV